MLVICVTTDKRYSKIPAFLQPLFIGFALLAIGISYGANSGYALNPVIFYAFFLNLRYKI
jgi:glycerol uptake facilitator-like aquaporin